MIAHVKTEVCVKMTDTILPAPAPMDTMAIDAKTVSELTMHWTNLRIPSDAPELWDLTLLSFRIKCMRR